MSSNDEQPKLSFMERMKQQALQQKHYGQEPEQAEQSARMEARDCPNCGAGRAAAEGLTHCAYCGFAFMEKPLTDGIYINKNNNSQH